MQHAAIVPGLMPADARFLFEHCDLSARIPFPQPVSRSQPHDAAANNRNLHNYQRTAIDTFRRKFARFRRSAVPRGFLWWISSYYRCESD